MKAVIKISLFIVLAWFFVSCEPGISFTTDDGWDESRLASRSDSPDRRKRRNRNKSSSDEEDVPSWARDLDKGLNLGGGKKGKNVRRGLSSDLVGEKPSGDASPLKVASNKIATGEGSPAREKAVDIIMIPDGSVSMGRFLSNVRDTFNGFIPALSPLDWKMWFINSEHGGSRLFLFPSRDGRAMELEDNGRLLVEQYTLTKSVSNHERIFMDTLGIHRPKDWHRIYSQKRKRYNTCLLPPHCQGWNEEPMKALKTSFANSRQHFRQNADIVAAVIITDSDEGRRSEDSDRVRAEYVLADFDRVFQKEKELLVYGITVKPGDTQCQNQYGRWLTNENAYAVHISELIQKTQGTNFSLCSQNFTPVAKKIVYDVQNSWQRQ